MYKLKKNQPSILKLHLPMKKIILLIVLHTACFFLNAQDAKDYLKCVIKTEYKWGSECKPCMTSAKTYRVRFVNDCNDTLMVRVAVQESHKRFRTFTFNQVLPKDSVGGFACNGTGKYFYWAKKWNDNTVELPGDDTINQLYAK